MSDLKAAILQALARIEALLRDSGQHKSYLSSTLSIDNNGLEKKKPLDLVHREALS